MLLLPLALTSAGVPCIACAGLEADLSTSPSRALAAIADAGRALVQVCPVPQGGERRGAQAGAGL